MESRVKEKLSISEANKFFNERRYEDALDLYQQIQKDRPDFASLIDTNIHLCKKRIQNDKKDLSVEKIIVYTVNIGGYESIKEPLNVDPTIDYILFTDDEKAKSKYWKIIHLEENLEDPRRTSRLPKILAHKYLPDHEISVYIDSSLELKEPNVRKMVSECMEGSDIALYKHYKRSCVYDEINFVMDSSDRVIADKELCKKAIEKYENINYPKNNGLFENAFIFRRNTKKIRELNELWWCEYHQGAERDQFTFMYALHQLAIKPNAIKVGKQFRNNPFVNFHKHQYKSYKSKKRPKVFIAYAPRTYSMNLGRCYNDYMERLKEDDYAVFIDHDAMFTDSGWHDLIQKIYDENNKEEALFITRTNRINNPYQRLNLLENNHSMHEHSIFAKELANKYGSQVVECAKLPSSSGVVIMLSKKTWHKHKFSDGFLKVDNNMHLSHRQAGDPVYLMQGLHVYHFYRADNDLSHAIKDIKTIENKTDSTIGHVVRNFVYHELNQDTIKSYMELLNDDEYGVFLPAQAMFCNKDWYHRITDELEKDPSIGFMVFNDNGFEEKAPIELDALSHKSFAAETLLKNSDCALSRKKSIEENGLSSFLISKKAWKKVSFNDVNTSLFSIFATAVGKVKQKSRFLNHVYVFDKNKNHQKKSIQNYLNNQLNIGVLTFGFWPQQAGMEMMVHNLATQLTKIGNNVVLFAPKPKKEYEELKGSYIIRRFKSKDDMKRIFKEHHEAMPFDVLYVQGAYEPASLALELKEELGVPVVLRTHGEDIQIDKESGYGYRLDPKKNEIILNNIRSVDHNVVIGPHILEEVKTLTDGPVSLIYNGVDTDHFKPGREYKIHEKFNLPKSTKVLITVGRNVKKKSFHLAIDALALIKKEYKDVVLVHAGKEGNGINLLEYAKERGVEDSFFQLGEISYFDMPSYYRSSDIFVFPAKTETFGNVTVEAMACGLPCVEFDYEVNKNKIVNGLSGFVIDYGDVNKLSQKIIDLIKLQSLYDKFSFNSRSRSMDFFSWNHVVYLYLNLFKMNRSFYVK